MNFLKLFLTPIVIISAFFSFTGNCLAQENNSLAEMFVLDRLFTDEKLLGDKKTTLGDVLLLDQLFDYPDKKIFSLGLGDLFVLDALFSKDSLILDQEKTSIGDLLILDQLFSDNNLFTKNNTHQDFSLGELFLLDRLFSNSSQGLLSSSTTSLGDLFILMQLF